MPADLIGEPITKAKRADAGVGVQLADIHAEKLQLLERQFDFAANASDLAPAGLNRVRLGTHHFAVGHHDGL